MYHKLKFRRGDHVESVSLLHDYGKRGIVTLRSHTELNGAENVYIVCLDDTGESKTFKESWLRGADL